MNPEDKEDSDEELPVLTTGTLLTLFLDWIVFYVDSFFSRVWYNFITMFSLISCITYLFPWIYGESKSRIYLFGVKPHSDVHPFVLFFSRLDYLQELFFFLNILKNFLTEIPIENSKKMDRNLPNIAINYLKTDFLFDLLAFFPFAVLFPGGEINDPWYMNLFLFKLIRLSRGLETFDVDSWIKFTN